MSSLQPFDIWPLPDPPRRLLFLSLISSLRQKPQCYFGVILPCDSCIPVSSCVSLICFFHFFLATFLSPLPFPFHSCHAEEIKVNVFKGRMLEYLVKRKKNIMHVQCSYTAQRIGRKYGRTTLMGNKYKHFHPHQ